MPASGSFDGDKDGSFEFDCPECGAHIKGDVTKCPNCGVEFVIEEVSETECPACGKLVPVESDRCPHCGVEFEVRGPKAEPEETPKAPEEPTQPEVDHEEEMRQQFPLLVAEVKPLMALAKEYDIDVSECRRLIDKAVRAGKQKDIATAVQNVKECRSSVRFAIEDRITHDAEHMERLIEVGRKMQGETGEMAESLKVMREKLAAGDFPGALEESKNGRKVAEKVTGKYLEAHDMYDSLNRLVQNSERFYVDVRDARGLLKEAQEAGSHGDWSMMGILARKGRDELMTSLPEVLKGELKKAKSTLLDSKADGKDISVMVKILKDAGLAMKREKYDEAMERLIDFKAEMKRV